MLERDEAHHGMRALSGSSGGIGLEQLRRRRMCRRRNDLSTGVASCVGESLRDERGLSLIEVVIASAISLVIVGALLASLGSGTRATSTTEAKHGALQELRGAMDRASTDIRQATDVSPASTSTWLDIQTLVAGTPKRMIFEVAGTSFRRMVCPDVNFDFTTPCGGVAAELASSITSSQAFCYDPPACTASGPPDAMRLVRITVAQSSTPTSDDSLTFASDVQLRNL
jgi:Tfp pilus assembly protein PilW